MEATVNDIIKVMDGIAPPNLAEPWDNVGLLVGRSSNTVKKLMVALDVSPEVVEQAVEHKVQMLVTHHPVIFDPIKKMTDRSWQHKLLLDCAENKIAVYSAHTSLDSVLGGVNDVLAEKIGLLHTEVLVPAAGGEAGLGRVGCLHEPMTLQEFSEKIKTVLKLDNIIAGDAGRRVSKVSVCGGAGAGVYQGNCRSEVLLPDRPVQPQAGRHHRGKCECQHRHGAEASAADADTECRCQAH